MEAGCVGLQYTIQLQLAVLLDDVIEYDIAFNIIYIMRTHVVVAKLRYPPLTK